jgi:methionyl-tRNA formyltransferase
MITDRPLRVVFLGTPAFAVPSLEGILRGGGDLRAVVCQPDRPKGRGLELVAPPVKQWALERGLPVLQPEKVKQGRLKALIEPYQPDVLVVTAYGRILPEEVLAMAPLGAINAHASLLPKYRGAAPIQWAVAKGETETGVTIMQMDAGLDTGDMLLVRKLVIGPEETAVGLHDRLAALSGDALAEALPMLARDELRPQKQDSSLATLAPILKKEDGYLDLRLSAVELSHRTRGFQPWPGAVLFLQGKSFKVHRAGVRPARNQDAPGTIVSVGESIGIQSGDGIYEVLEIQPEGKRRMAAKDMLSGHRLAVGERFDVLPPGSG